MKSTQLKLPTLAAFKRLSFTRKARVFRDWAARQKGGYDSTSIGSCAIHQFATALGVSEHTAWAYDFELWDGTEIPVLDDSLVTYSPIHAKDGGSTTFHALTKRLDTYIAKHYGNL